MEKDRRAYNRHTARLKNYDYTQPGLYFITICTHEKKWAFGEIINDEMQLNITGQMVQSIWHTLPEQCESVALGEFVIMPNHIHGIIELQEKEINTLQTPYHSNLPERFRPYMHKTWGKIDQCATEALPPHPVGRDKSGPYAASRLHTAPSLGEVVRTFKAVSTHSIHNSGTTDFMWQSNYYEHIIRNDKDLDRIRQYIINNPADWAKDSLNIKECLTL